VVPSGGARARTRSVRRPRLSNGLESGTHARQSSTAAAGRHIAALAQVFDDSHGGSPSAMAPRFPDIRLGGYSNSGGQMSSGTIRDAPL
jgi:hypothetical protein